MATTAPPLELTPTVKVAPRDRFIVLKREDLSTCKGPAVQALSCYMHDPDKLSTLTLDDRTLEGSPSKTYKIPRDLLVWLSSYFAVQVDLDSSLERGALTIDGRHDIFDAFTCWMYTGRLRDPPSDPATATREELYLSPETLCLIWIFADLRGVSGLGNAAIDMYHEVISAVWALHSRVNNVIYRYTKRGCSLRRFIVDAFVRTNGLKKIVNGVAPTATVPEFLLEAMSADMDIEKNNTVLGRDEWMRTDRCQWHDHSGPRGKLPVESRK